MTTSEFLDAALAYAAMGWRVFPLLPKSKEPATAHGFKDAVTDEGKIREWWKQNPNYNVGIATGHGLCVVDVDDKPKNAVQGSDMLRDWELEHGDITPTVTAITGTGGVHYYYDVGATGVPSCQSDTVFIDLRCEGGYVVAPPSVHPNGTAYAWDASPEDMPPAKVSDTDKSFVQWVYDHRKGAGKDGQRERAKVPEGKVHEGEGRNRFLYEQGCSARAKGSDDEMIEIWLTELNKAKCMPPLDDRELMKVVGSVCTKPVGLSDEAKATKAGRPRRFDHEAAARTLIDERGACFIDGMPAVRDGDVYRTGWEGIDAALVSMERGTTTSNRREVKALLQILAPRLRQSPPTLIGFMNGVLDVETMELRPYGSGDVIPNVVPHRWVPGARSDLLSGVLDRMACGDVGTAMNLTEFMGLCIARSSRLWPYFPVLTGEGSNGKSTYIRLLRDLAGAENVSALQPSDIASRFSGAHLVGKTANLGDDISGAFLDANDCAVIKKVATGDLLFTDVKNGEGFEFEPYATMVFSCNRFPRLGDTSYGMLRRLFPVHFGATFGPGGDGYDPRIGEKLAAEEAMEAACVMAVEGLLRVMAQGMPTPNEASLAMVGDIERDSDTVAAWLFAEGLTADDFVGRALADVYADYAAWCVENGYERTRKGSGTVSSRLVTTCHISLTGFERQIVGGEWRTRRVFERKEETD